MVSSPLLLLVVLSSAHAASPRWWAEGATASRPETCSPQLVGRNLDVDGHDLRPSIVPNANACTATCCADPKCGGALFEAESAVSYGGCIKGKPCCFMKTIVAGSRPMPNPPAGGSELWIIPGRSQDDEKLNFLSATLGSHMVLQRAPQQAVVWGHTAPGATVTTTMVRVGDNEVTPKKFEAIAGTDGTWRQLLPPTPASKQAYDFSFASSNSTAEQAVMNDVLFGDVYICGGQSNMEFAMPAVANATAEKQEANDFPTIRFFSVGHSTQSRIPLRDLQTVWEPWQVASSTSINRDYGPGHTLFSTFSAVCWLFGKELSARLSPTGNIPIGLISNNWGGTQVEVWTPASAYTKCNRTGPDGPMFNAMILPYAEGPMAISGFTFYQGEANTASAATAEQYACLFPQMIASWREAFNQPSAFFSFVQLSTWCALPPESLPQMREAQMAALQLPNVGYATNADHGMGCNIHPAEKQFVSARLATSALALHYKQSVPWRSPTYSTALQLLAGGNSTNSESSVSVIVNLHDVTSAGLHTIYPSNYYSQGYGPADIQVPSVVDCFSSFPINATTNSSMTEQCAWAALHVNNTGWLNATVSVHQEGQALVLSAQLPGNSIDPIVVGSSYGWGPIPMMNAYDKGSGLPVLPWNRSL